MSDYWNELEDILGDEFTNSDNATNDSVTSSSVPSGNKHQDDYDFSEFHSSSSLQEVKVSDNKSEYDDLLGDEFVASIDSTSKKNDYNRQIESKNDDYDFLGFESNNHIKDLESSNNTTSEYDHLLGDKFVTVNANTKQDKSSITNDPQADDYDFSDFYSEDTTKQTKPNRSKSELEDIILGDEFESSDDSNFKKPDSDNTEKSTDSDDYDFSDYESSDELKSNYDEFYSSFEEID